MKEETTSFRRLLRNCFNLRSTCSSLKTLPSIHEAKRATKTIPIVMVAGVDPVAAGLVDSFAQPGGYLMGATRLFQELSGKRLELLLGDCSDDIAGRSAPDGGLWQKSGRYIQTVLRQPGKALKIQIEPLENSNPQPTFH